MNIPVSTVILAMFLHFLGDFVLQTDAMAKGKSKSLKWLSIHIAVYMLPLALLGWKYALINGALHFIIDYFTSRESSYRWKQGETHNFFVVIGFDQYLHTAFLLLTLEFIYPLWRYFL